MKLVGLANTLHCRAVGPLTLLATVDELSSVDTLSSNEELCPLLKPVRVTEGYFGQWSTTTWIVDDIL